MPLVIPGLAFVTHGTNGYDAQTVPDPTDVAALQGVGTGTGVVTGCALTPQGTPNMTGQLSAGWVMVNGLFYQVSAVNPVTFATASTTDRKDIVIYTVGTGVVVTQGTVCGTAGWTRALTGTALPPEKAALPANSALLWESTINSSTSSVNTINFVDKRAPIAATPGTLLARVQPAAHATYTTAVATVAAVDATNVTITFVGPPSGAITLTAQFTMQMGTAAGFATLNWLNHGLSTIFGNSVSLTLKQDLVANAVPITYTTLITGLTAGTTYQADLGWAATSGDTASIFPNVAATTAVGTAAAGPILLTAIAA